ncbi:hypothetical protein Kyoto83A_15190 [Helicobacter pylori]
MIRGVHDLFSNYHDLFSNYHDLFSNYHDLFSNYQQTLTAHSNHDEEQNNGHHCNDKSYRSQECF